jgi:hypothetical protein
LNRTPAENPGEHFFVFGALFAQKSLCQRGLSALLPLNPKENLQKYGALG